MLLQWLNNSDKHQVPSIVLIAPTEIAHSASIIFYSDEDASANVPPDATIWAGPLKPDVVLLEHRTNRPVKLVSGKWEGHAIIAMQTNHELVSVEKTMLLLCNYTALAVDQFRGFFEQ